MLPGRVLPAFISPDGAHEPALWHGKAGRIEEGEATIKAGVRRRITPVAPRTRRATEERRLTTRTASPLQMPTTVTALTSSDTREMLLRRGRPTSAADALHSLSY